MKLSEIASLLGGVSNYKNDLDILGISSISSQKPNTAVFVDERHKDANFQQDIVYISELELPALNSIKVKNLKYAMAILLDKLYKEEPPKGISDKAFVEAGVSVGKDVYIGPFAYIGKNVHLGDNVLVYPFTYIGDNTIVGDNTILYSGVHIYKNTVVGKNVIIHSGAVIGTDGFGYAIGPDGIKKLKHIGNVIIEDDVEIGANTTIDRALIDSTLIGKSTKIDNLVMIGHNCKVGQNCFLVSQVGLSGSVSVGDNSILAGQVGVADHVNIGSNVKVAAKSGVAYDLPSNNTYGANLPSIEWAKWRRVYVSLLKLPDILKKLNKP
ncbi:UDP-3-O-(3-hydroxymyristoyl)glucosamine N-acyltransferase [Hydrogenobaculum acidophilum]